MRTHPAVWAALILAVLWLGLRWFERVMVFSPMRTMFAHPGTVGLAYDSFWLTTSDGVRLRAWWISGPSAESPVMLCLHGNGGNISTRTDKMRIFHDAGAAQLWIDWRGYGESGGWPSEAGLYRDAQAAWTWLNTVTAVPSNRLVIYGESLGCGPAVELVGRSSAAGLIMDGGFSSILDMGRFVLPWFPVRLAKFRFDNLAKLPKVLIPTLFLHSPDDEVIPYQMAKQNFAASGAAKKSLVDLKGSHNEGFLDTGPAYGTAVKKFLADIPKPAKK